MQDQQRNGLLAPTLRGLAQGGAISGGLLAN
jgi:hypothetical protein